MAGLVIAAVNEISPKSEPGAVVLGLCGALESLGKF